MVDCCCEAAVVTGKESPCFAGKTRNREGGVSATAGAKILQIFAGDSPLLLAFEPQLQNVTLTRSRNAVSSGWQQPAFLPLTLPSGCC